MSRPTIEKIPFNYEIFKKVMKYRGLSQESAADLAKISPRSIYRAKQDGCISLVLLKLLCQNALNIRTDYFAGSQFQDKEKWTKNYIDWYMKTRPIDSCTYADEEKENVSTVILEEATKKLFMALGMEEEKYKKLDFVQKLDMNYDVIDAVCRVLYKHYPVDEWGNDTWEKMDILKYYVDSQRDDYYEKQYVKEILRPRMIKNPPEGYTAEEIMKMPYFDVMGLDAALQHQ